MMGAVDRILDRTALFVAATSERLNPILVKETRQSTKSALFSTVFLLFVSISWIVIVFGMLMMWSTLEISPAAEVLFAWNYGLLSFAIFVVVPFGAYRSLLAERELHTLDLLTITTLSPRQIVFGKLGSALVQVGIYYSAISPFIAFLSFLQGFDILLTSWVLVMSFFWSLALCTGALLASIMARHNQWNSANMVGLVILLLFGWIMTLAFAVAGDVRREMADPGFWFINAIGLVFGLSYVFLAIQVIVARLTFAAGNHSTSIRLVLSGQSWLLLIGLAVIPLLPMGSISPRDYDDVLGGAAILVSIHWVVGGLFLVTESDFLSRRIRSGLPRRKLVRLLVSPFLPGSSRGLVLIYGHLLVFVLATVALSLWRGVPESVDLQQMRVGGVANVVLWMGIATAISRWCRRRSHRFTPVAMRVLTVVLFIVAQIASLLPEFVDALPRSLSFLCPFLLPEMHNQHLGFALGFLVIAAVLSVVVNLRAMFQGAMQIVRDPGPGQLLTKASSPSQSSEVVSSAE